MTITCDSKGLPRWEGRWGGTGRRRRKRKKKRRKGNHNQDILYEKNLFSIEEKKSTNKLITVLSKQVNNKTKTKNKQKNQC